MSTGASRRLWVWGSRRSSSSSSSAAAFSSRSTTTISSRNHHHHRLDPRITNHHGLSSFVSFPVSPVSSTSSSGSYRSLATLGGGGPPWSSRPQEHHQPFSTTNDYSLLNYQHPIHSYTRPHSHWFSTTTASKPKDEDDNDEKNTQDTRTERNESSSSFRHRARERANRAQVAGAKGAKTASDMMRQYGPVFVGTYLSVYVATLATLFVGVDSGLLDPLTISDWISIMGQQQDAATGTDTSTNDDETKTAVKLVVQYMEAYSWTQPYAHVIEQNPHVANLAISWVAVKFTEPIRLAVTLAIVPRLARHFGFVPVVIKNEDDENKKKYDRK